jgi:hypothetical protein
VRIEVEIRKKKPTLAYLPPFKLTPHLPHTTPQETTLLTQEVASAALQAASASLTAIGSQGVGVSPSDLADLLGVASNVLRERGRLASATEMTDPLAVAAAAAEAAELGVSFFKEF